MNMKHIIAIVIALTMVFSLGTVAFAADCNYPFRDIPEGAWYAEDVEWAHQQGIVHGYDMYNFLPNEPVTRAHAVTMLYNLRYDGSPLSTDVIFSDVSPDAWYYEAVTWACDVGIVKGFPDGTFRPYDICTRGQIATLIYRAFIDNGTLPETIKYCVYQHFTDIPESQYYYVPVNFLAMIDVLKGYPDGTFGPNRSCSRAEMCAIIHRACYFESL